MKQIKTLTVNGQTFEISDPDAITKEQLDDAIAAAGGAAVEKSYELIEDITLTESVTSIVRDTDTNGNPYNFSAVRILAEVPACEGVQANSKIIFSLDGAKTSYFVYRGVSNAIATTAKATSFVARNDHGSVEHYSVVASAISSAGNLQSKPDDMLVSWENVITVRMQVDKSAGVELPAGARFRIYGVRG